MKRGLVQIRIFQIGHLSKQSGNLRLRAGGKGARYLQSGDASVGGGAS